MEKLLKNRDWAKAPFVDGIVCNPPTKAGGNSETIQVQFNDN